MRWQIKKSWLQALILLIGFIGIPMLFISHYDGIDEILTILPMVFLWIIAAIAVFSKERRD